MEQQTYDNFDVSEVDDCGDGEIISLSALGSEAVAFDAGKAVTAGMIWGRVITELRKNGPHSLYALVCDTGGVELSGGVLTVKVHERDYDYLVDYTDKLQAMVERGGINARLLLIKRKDTEQDELFAELEIIKKRAKNIKLTII